MHKRINLSDIFRGGLRLFKGLFLLFLPNVPGAMFIQGGTFIPDSRVGSIQVSASDDDPSEK